MATEPLTPLQFMALAASRIDPSRVATKHDGMSYIEAYDARATLIQIFGYGGYSYQVEQSEIIQIERDVPKTGGGTTNFRVTAMVRGRLYVPQLDCYYSGVAVANQSGAAIGDVADFAVKTADSDAFKRCCMNLGTQFGLSLYASEGKNVHYNDVVGVVYAPGYEFQVTEKRLKAAGMFADGKLAIEQVVEPDPKVKALLARALRTDRENEEHSHDDVPMALDPTLGDSSMDGAETHSVP